MLRKLIIGLASAAALTASVVTPAMADIPYCMRYPNPDNCPYGGSPQYGGAGGTPQAAHVFHGKYYQRHHEPTAQKA
jgi:hypothetical protein